MVYGTTTVPLINSNYLSTGRILNRFTKDMGSLDEILPRTLLDVFQIYGTLGAILILNAIALYWTLIPSAVLLIFFFFMVKVYLKTAQGIKRLEGTSELNLRYTEPLIITVPLIFACTQLREIAPFTAQSHETTNETLLDTTSGCVDTRHPTLHVLLSILTNNASDFNYQLFTSLRV